MYLKKLSIKNLRLIDKLEFTAHPGINIICGNNGAGKSTILEAIYLLARNKSFRNSKIQNLIRNNANKLQVSASIEKYDGFIQHITLTKSSHTTILSLNGQEQGKLTSVAYGLPIGIITPDIQKLISEGPSQRRRLVDWSMFHVEQKYAALISRYKKILNQRNQALISGLSTIALWDDQLETISHEINSIRTSNWNSIELDFLRMIEPIFPAYKFAITFKQGWEKNKTLKESLQSTIITDQKRGYTSIGPHRSDLVIKINGKHAKQHLSNGEQKIIGILLILSCLKHIKKITNESPILLCDDIFSELDNKNLNKLLKLVEKETLQTFITTLNKNIDWVEPGLYRLFHVEQGEFV